MPRALVPILGALLVFGAIAAVMVELTPGPLKDSDFMVIGSVATLVALLVLFVVSIAISKSSNVFFKKRKK